MGGMNNQKVYIFGNGRFGSRAFHFLTPRFQHANMTVVDKKIDCLKPIIAQGSHAVAMDAVSFLTAAKAKMDLDDWIVPAVPIHLAFEWLQQELQSACRAIPVPKALENLLPNAMRGTDGQIYVSNADFICPDDCPEPAAYCTVTGEPRPQVLCDTLSCLKLPGFLATCIVSSQLAPGVGGYQWRTLCRALEDIKAHPGDMLVSTACKCHGVMHALRYCPTLELVCTTTDISS